MDPERALATLRAECNVSGSLFALAAWTPPYHLGMNCLADVESQWLPGTPGSIDTRIRALLVMTDGLPIAERLRALVDSSLLRLPAMGEGHSANRLRALVEIGAVDLSLARLAESHTDALALLIQAGESADDDALYGVWVEGEEPLIASSEQPTLAGDRPYCAGAGIIDRALVTGALDEHVLLLEIDARRPEVIALDGTWPAVGMSATASYTVRFANCPSIRVIGAPDFYRERASVGQGSLDVAACWYGGALGLAGTYISAPPSAINPAALAHIDVALRTMVLHLNHAANETDNPTSGVSAELLALRCRHAVYEGCQNVLNIVAEAGGIHLSTHHAAQARRLADLPTYLRQRHPAWDSQRLGQLLLNSGTR